MKKIVCLVMSLMLALGIPFTASAATRNEVIATIEEDIPKDYRDIYIDTIKNIFSQIETTDEQCDKLIEIINRFSSTLDLTKGHSMHNYTAKEKEYIFSIVDEICALLNISYKIVPKYAGELHINDIKAMIYGPNGELLGELDGDIIKRTDSPDRSVDFTGLYASGILLLAAAGAFLLRKRFIAVV